MPNGLNELLMGPQGGAMAICFVTGVGVGWRVAWKYVATRLAQKVDKLESKVDDLYKEIIESYKNP